MERATEHDAARGEGAAVDRIVAEYRREVVLRGLFTIACRAGALAFVALYFYFGIYLERTEVFYVTLNLAGVATGLSSFVVIFYFEIPQVVRDLHGADASRADASWAAIERLRGELLPRLFDALWMRPEERDALVRSIDRPTLVRMTAERAQDRWRRRGKIYLGVYGTLAALYLALVAFYDPRPPGLR